jgi:hypothetical protein
MLATAILTFVAGIISICTYFSGFSYQGSAHKYYDPVYFFAGELILLVAFYLTYRIYCVLRPKSDL